MKAKLLRKLRREIINNINICWFSQWSGALYTHLCGKKYYGYSHSPNGLANPQTSKELEHIPLEAYISSKRK